MAAFRRLVGAGASSWPRHAGVRIDIDRCNLTATASVWASSWAGAQGRVATRRMLSTAPTDPPKEPPTDSVAEDASDSAAAAQAFEMFNSIGDAEKLRRSLLAIQEQQQQLLALSAKLTAMGDLSTQKHDMTDSEADDVVRQDSELNAVAVGKLLARLAEVRGYIPHSEYLEICADFGIEDGAADLLLKLQESGQLVRCENTPLADLVLLNPSELMQRLAVAAERPPGTCPVVLRQHQAAASARLERLSKQLSELDERKQHLDRRASRTVSRYMTLGLGVWSMQVAVYYHLVYAPGALSWDVMEPVAYFTLEAATIGWWLYVPSFDHI